MTSTLEARVSKHDREIAAIRKLVLQGMKMIIGLEKAVDRMAGQQEVILKDMRELQASQRKTEAMVQGLVRSLAKGSNGHGKSS